MKLTQNDQLGSGVQCGITCASTSVLASVREVRPEHNQVELATDPEFVDSTRIDVVVLGHAHSKWICDVLVPPDVVEDVCVDAAAERDVIGTQHVQLVARFHHKLLTVV